MKVIASILFLVVFGTPDLWAQGKTVTIEMEAAHWVVPEDARFEPFDNRKTLWLDGKATVKGHRMADGRIEVEVYANTARSFAGLVFRKEGPTLEEVYMRMHKSGQVDAVQYSPTFRKEATWQLYREYQAQVAFLQSGWNTLRVDVAGATAEVFVNGKPVLSVDHLRTGHTDGEMGLFALLGNRFANFRYTPAQGVEAGRAGKAKEAAPGVITAWAITAAQEYDPATFELKPASGAGERTVPTETSGLLPFSKYLEKPSSGAFEQNKEAYTVASTTIRATAPSTKAFSFDYSDKIRVYLNGQLLFAGNNAFRSKGPQHTGHLGMNANTLYLPLEQGDNLLQCVVIDKANGWGLMGRLD